MARKDAAHNPRRKVSAPDTTAVTLADPKSSTTNKGVASGASFTSPRGLTTVPPTGWGTDQIPDDLPKLSGEKPPLQVYGAPGTPIFNGIIQDDAEYNPDFYWRQGCDIFEKMRRSDGTVKALEQQLMLPLLSAKWFIEPASQDEADVGLAQFIEHALLSNNIYRVNSRGDKLTQSWPEVLRHILSMLTFGFSLFELCYRVDAETGWTYWSEWRPLLARTVWKWLVDAENDLVGIQQRTWKNYRYEYVDIPIEKVLRFTHQQEGGNFEGVSILRAAYQHWYYKQTYYKVQAIGVERNAVSYPFIFLPPGASEADITAAQRIVRNMRVAEDMGGTLPADSRVEFPNHGGDRGHIDINGPIEHHDSQILRSALAQFLQNGSLENGTRAMDQTQGDRFLQALQSVANYICDVVNNDAIPKLIGYNFDNVAQYPRLVCPKLTSQDLTMLGNALGLLQTYINPADPVVVPFLFEMFGLPQPTLAAQNPMQQAGQQQGPDDGQTPPDGSGGSEPTDAGAQQGQPQDAGQDAGTGMDANPSDQGGMQDQQTNQMAQQFAELAQDLTDQLDEGDAVERAAAHLDLLELADAEDTSDEAVRLFSFGGFRGFGGGFRGARRGGMGGYNESMHPRGWHGMFRFNGGKHAPEPKGRVARGQAEHGAEEEAALRGFGRRSGGRGRQVESNPLEERLGAVERRIAGLPHEQAHVFSPKGDLMWSRGQGAADAVHFAPRNPSDLGKLKGAIVTHNHPSGAVHSPEDFKHAYGHGIGQLRVVRPNGDVHIFEPGKGSWEQHAPLYHAIHGRLRSAWAQEVAAGHTTPEEAAFRISHGAADVFAKAVGAKYRVIPHDQAGHILEHHGEPVEHEGQAGRAGAEHPLEGQLQPAGFFGRRQAAPATTAAPFEAPGGPLGHGAIVHWGENEQAARAALHGLFGRHLQDHEVAMLTGARPGEHVHVEEAHSLGKGHHHVGLKVRGNGYQASHVVTTNYAGEGRRERPAGVRVGIGSMTVGNTNQGLGSEVFARQVAGAQRMGVDNLHLRADGRPSPFTSGPPQGMNGHYSWARLGFDGPIEEKIYTRQLRAEHPEIRNAKTVQDIMNTPEVTLPNGMKMSGREFWKNHGTGWYGKFDLKPGSKHIETLQRYLAEREARRQPLIHHNGEPVQREGGQGTQGAQGEHPLAGQIERTGFFGARGGLAKAGALAKTALGIPRSPEEMARTGVGRYGREANAPTLPRGKQQPAPLSPEITAAHQAHVAEVARQFGVTPEQALAHKLAPDYQAFARGYAHDQQQAAYNAARQGDRQAHLAQHPEPGVAAPKSTRAAGAKSGGKSGARPVPGAAHSERETALNHLHEWLMAATRDHAGAVQDAQRRGVKPKKIANDYLVKDAAERLRAVQERFDAAQSAHHSLSEFEHLANGNRADEAALAQRHADWMQQHALPTARPEALRAKIASRPVPGVTIEDKSEGRAGLRELFGREFTDAEIHHLAGAHEGDRVVVSGGSPLGRYSHGGVDFQVFGPKGANSEPLYRFDHALHRDEKTGEIYDKFHTADVQREHQKQGAFSRHWQRMARALSALGVRGAYGLSMGHGTEHDDEPGGYNGRSHYVMGLHGFHHPGETDELANFKTPEGRAHVMAHGHGGHMVMDLRPGSASMQQLEAYAAEKGHGAKPAKTKSAPQGARQATATAQDDLASRIQPAMFNRGVKSGKPASQQQPPAAAREDLKPPAPKVDAKTLRGLERAESTAFDALQKAVDTRGRLREKLMNKVGPANVESHPKFREAVAREEAAREALHKARAAVVEAKGGEEFLRNNQAQAEAAIRGRAGQAQPQQSAHADEGFRIHSGSITPESAGTYGVSMYHHLAERYGRGERNEYDSPQQREAVLNFAREYAARPGKNGKAVEWEQGFRMNGKPFHRSVVEGDESSIGGFHPLRQIHEAMRPGAFASVHVHPGEHTATGKDDFSSSFTAHGTPFSGGDIAQYVLRKPSAGYAVARLGDGAVVYQVRPKGENGWGKEFFPHELVAKIQAQRFAKQFDNEVGAELERQGAKQFRKEHGRAYDEGRDSGTKAEERYQQLTGGEDGGVHYEALRRVLARHGLELSYDVVNRHDAAAKAGRPLAPETRAEGKQSSASTLAPHQVQRTSTVGRETAKTVTGKGEEFGRIDSQLKDTDPVKAWQQAGKTREGLYQLLRREPLGILEAMAHHDNMPTGGKVPRVIANAAISRERLANHIADEMAIRHGAMERPATQTKSAAAKPSRPAKPAVPAHIAELKAAVDKAAAEHKFVKGNVLEANGGDAKAARAHPDVKAYAAKLSAARKAYREAQAIARGKQPATPKVGDADYGHGTVESMPEMASARKVLGHLFGRVVTDSELADMVGAQADDRVRVLSSGKNAKSGESYVMLALNGANGRYHAIRRLAGTPGDVHMGNIRVQVSRTGEGTGTALFGRQVEGLHAAGVHRIGAEATRRGEDGVDYNGYYSLARHGWDGAIPAGVRDQVARIPELKQAKTVQDVMRAPKVSLPDGKQMTGAQWWKQHGDTFKATFDTRPDSSPRQVFEAYREAQAVARGEQPAATKAAKPAKAPRTAQAKGEAFARIDSQLAKLQDPTDPHEAWRAFGGTRQGLHDVLQHEPLGVLEAMAQRHGLGMPKTFDNLKTAAAQRRALAKHIADRMAEHYGEAPAKPATARTPRALKTPKAPKAPGDLVESARMKHEAAQKRVADLEAQLRANFQQFAKAPLEEQGALNRRMTGIMTEHQKASTAARRAETLYKKALAAGQAQGEQRITPVSTRPTPQGDREVQGARMRVLAPRSGPARSQMEQTPTLASATAERPGRGVTVESRGERSRARVNENAGKTLSDEEIAKLAGAPAGARVVIHPGGIFQVHDANGQVLHTAHIQRQEDGSRHLQVMYFTPRPDPQGLLEQIAAARRLGVTRLFTKATGFEGQHTYLPQLGWDTPMKEVRHESKLNPTAKVQADPLPQSAAHAKTLSDLLSTPEGRKWWRDNGLHPHMEFDISPKSRSIRQLVDYLKKRAQAGQTGNPEGPQVFADMADITIRPRAPLSDAEVAAMERRIAWYRKRRRAA